MSEYIIELNKVSCKTGRRHLLKDINWQVTAGEHWVVFGMNGSGKTTLLSIIAGFKHFTEGEVKVLGEKFSNENILNIRKHIGWVSSSFFDKYYTKESALHIVLSGKHGTLGLADDITLDDVRLARALLKELSLEDKADRPFEMLSKGERQNVLIARALFSDPDILILDEPCNGLDVYNRSYLFSIIEELSQKKKMTIIYVTHYVEEISPLFQKCLLLKGGRIFAQGEIDQIFNDEVFQELLGYPVNIKKDTDGGFRLRLSAEANITTLLRRGEKQ